MTTIHPAFALCSVLLFAAPSPAQDESVRFHLYTLRGEDFFDYTGHAAAFLGDLDGDGMDEFAVTSPSAYQDGAGSVVVRRGATGKVLYEATGNDPADAVADRYGFSLAVLDDLDGDGAPEFAVGAPWDDDGASQSGVVHVHSGATGERMALLAGAVLEGELGWAVTGLGDLNGDGYGDFAAGAPEAGQVRAFSGEWVAQTWLGGTPVSAPVLWFLDGGWSLGSSLAGVGDVSGDGVEDLAVGEPWATGVAGEYAGAIHLVDGASGLLLTSWEGGAAGDELGRSLARSGDLTGDGEPELLAGVPGHDGFAADAGRVFVYTSVGLEAAAIGGATPPPTQFVFDGLGAGDRFGFAVAAGDIDGDGTPDPIATAIAGGVGGDVGSVRVFSGQTGAQLVHLEGEDVGGRTGWSIRSGGDANGDGFEDLLLGSPREGELSQGALRVFSGAGLSLTSDTHLMSVDTGGTAQLTLDGGVGSAGFAYLVLGTTSGTSPGVPLPNFLWPLNVDAYTTYTLSPHGELKQFFGILDGAGRGNAQIVLPGGLSPALIGFQYHYAWLGIDLAMLLDPLVSASNPVPLGFFQDDCSLASGGADCNGNGILDDCDIADGTSLDCNGNGIPDECDISSGTSLDLEGDGLPDECQRIVYVDIDAIPGGDGTSWATAYASLSVATGLSKPYDQLWVAEGRYPHQGEGDAYQLKARVSWYGGFAGFETDLSQRDWVNNETILDGDVNGDDLPGFQNYLDNARTVVNAGYTVGPDSIVDGFTVRGGNADEVAGCTLWAVYSPVCQAGGIYTLGNPRFRNLIVKDNFAGYQGGAVFTDRDPTFVNCVFEGNNAISGGAVYTDIGGAPEFHNCSFIGNSALEGGAVFSLGASSDGPRYANCVFAGNTALATGGAMHAIDVAPEILNSTFWANQSFDQGGGYFGQGTADAGFYNSILWGNTALAASGEAAQTTGTPATFSRSIVEGWTGTLPGTGTNGNDPLFVDPLGLDLIAGTADDDLRLQSGSPAIDSGNDTLLPADTLDVDGDLDLVEVLPTDRAGNPREVNDPFAPDSGAGVAPIVDRGAFERVP